mmetsp:Transcript_6629/g.16272  ORF Transcript_6629/g.16272 Transcript_6629/m.16272 type:complete len:142 (+) Transcript_6629:613-1038(+)
MIENAVNSCRSMLPLITQEEELIRHGQTVDPEPPRPPPKQGKGQIVASVHLTKESIRDAVFQMRNQPTMSIEEFGRIQREEAEKREKRQREQEALRVQERDLVGQEVAGSDAQEDAAQLKARNWDDWKDDNPKGAGNTQRY